MAKFERDQAGNQIIGVRTISDPTGRIYAYSWAGSVDLQLGDQLVIVVNGKEWEVEVVEYGTNYRINTTPIGGSYGLSYTTPQSWTKKSAK